ncbi:MAG TPA: DUF6265 family protein [Casimicrobiaceae bacterium]|nr:DUF6265 family protein [Casimicrobiaceae bacterium]
MVSLAIAAIACPFPARSAPAATAAPQPAPAATPAAAKPSLDALAWLSGCWLGAANRREFREQWSPPRGGMMVGFSHTVLRPRSAEAGKDAPEAPAKEADSIRDRTQDFEYLRIEQRDDGVYYVAIPSGKKEFAFKLSAVKEDAQAKSFTFTNVVDQFPQRIVYRRGTEGWLYAEVEGKPGAKDAKDAKEVKEAKDKDVVYPMRHIDCATSALLKQ